MSIKANNPLTLKSLLSITNVMFLFLAKVDAIDHSINRVITQIRVYLLDQWMQFHSRKWAVSFQQVENSVAEDAMRGFPPRTGF